MCVTDPMVFISKLLQNERGSTHNAIQDGCSEINELLKDVAELVSKIFNGGALHEAASQNAERNENLSSPSWLRH